MAIFAENGCKMEKKRVQKRLMSSNNRMELMARTTGAEVAASRNLTALGIRHMKQYPIYTGRKTYYADIYIPSMRAVIEIDGGYHYTDRQKRLDRNRSAGIRRLGYHVLRLSNRDARDINKIKSKLSILK